MSAAPAVVQDSAIPTTTTTTDGLGQTNTDNPRSTETPALGPGEGKPADKDTVEAVPNVANVPKEENLGKGEVLIESHPINEGILNYKGSGLKGLIFSKKYFWFSDAPLEQKNLSAYLGNEKTKDIAHANAAHATQSGKGLLFYAKRAEDKDHPQGILNLADMTDLAKGNFNDFSANLHGHKHTFQTLSKSERDGWLVAIEPKMADAKTSREGIVGSEGYKNQLEKYGKPGAAAGITGTSRSLSRHKKASKSRERTKDAAISKETTTPATSTAADPMIDGTDKGTTGDITAETVAGPTAGVAAVGAATRKGSISDEEKKLKKNEKGRSQSRNKRGSIFGGLLAKKDEVADKNAAKKIEKEEKKEEKAEEKAIKQEVKKEEKAEQKAERELEKEAKHDGTGQTGDFDAEAVASRVMGAPVVPVTGNTTTGTPETTPATVAEPLSATEATSTTTPTSSATSSATPKPVKRSSVFSGLFGKKDAVTNSTTNEASPPVPAKDESAAVSSTAPQLENPITSPASDTKAPTTGSTKTEPTPATEAVAPTSAVSPTDKRRSSFFSNLGTKKEKKPTASGEELTDSETKKQGGGLGGLLRKASRAQPRKDNATPMTDPAQVPLSKERHAGDKTVTNGEQAAQQPATVNEEVGANAITKNEQSKPIEATA